jgi:hypothetical protein
MSIALQLHARSEPANCCYSQLSERVQEQERSSVAAASASEVVPAGAVGRKARGAATWRRASA